MLAVSETTVGPEDEFALGGPVFRIDVEFPDGFALSEPQRRSLRPGMTVSAEIVRDHATLIDWLIEPLQGAARRL